MRQSKNFDRICFVLREAGIYDEKVVRSARLVQAKSGENSAEGFSGKAGGSAPDNFLIIC